MIGSGAKVRGLLAAPEVTAVVVWHRDLLGRMNAYLAGSALLVHSRRLVVPDDEDLVDDMVAVLTSFCARLYDRRPARNRAWKAAGCAHRNTGPQAAVGAGWQDAGS